METDQDLADLLSFLQVFTLPQMKMLLQYCRQVQASGYGTVEIQFKDGQPRYITYAQREMLPKVDDPPER